MDIICTIGYWSKCSFSNIPPVTSNTSHGSGTLTEVEVKPIRSIQVLSSGQGYTQIPVVSQPKYKDRIFTKSPDKVGPNSVFVTLGSGHKSV